MGSFILDKVGLAVPALRDELEGVLEAGFYCSMLCGITGVSVRGIESEARDKERGVGGVGEGVRLPSE